MEDRNCDIFRKILEQIPEGIVVLDPDDKIVFVNKAAEKIRHVKQENLIGRKVLLCHPEKSPDKEKRALDYVKNREKGTFIRIVEDKSLKKFYENTYSPIWDNDAYLGSMVISRDITRRKQLEDEHTVYVHRLEETVNELTTKNEGLFISSLSSLIAALEAKDEYTKGHSMRVCDIALKMLEHRHGFLKNKREIEIASELHDIGKVGIKETILFKPGRLTLGEFNIIKQHSIIGEKILSPIERLGSITKIVRHHHERFDGTGYPDGLKGDEIPVGSRIIAIADSYDAMTSDRPYRRAMDPFKSCEEIRKNLGSQFDPEWGEVFIDLFETGSI